MLLYTVISIGLEQLYQVEKNKYSNVTHTEWQCKSNHQYVTKTQVGNKNISNTFMVHKTKNCDENKNVAWNDDYMLIARK